VGILAEFRRGAADRARHPRKTQSIADETDRADSLMLDCLSHLEVLHLGTYEDIVEIVDRSRWNGSSLELLEPMNLALEEGLAAIFCPLS
jgi:hypothetical protein